jgi:hypothetical protein
MVLTEQEFIKKNIDYINCFLSESNDSKHKEIVKIYLKLFKERLKEISI